MEQRHWSPTYAPTCAICQLELVPEALDSDHLLIVYSCPDHGLAEAVDGFDGH